MKQADLFNSVCEKSKSISTSDANSIVSTSTETTGPTHTKYCMHCSIELTEDVWTEGNAKNYNYICRVCDSIKRKKNKLKKLAKNIGADTLRSYNKVKSGEVYIIVNNAWPGWVKIGMAVYAEDRLTKYQTGSPLRDYVLAYSVYTEDRRKTEREAHKAAEAIAERNGEWFKMSIGQAKECIQHGL